MKDPVLTTAVALVGGAWAVAYTLIGEWSDALVIACFVGTLWFAVNTALIGRK